MRHLKEIQLLGDSILKGIQVEPETKRYITKNDMDVAGLERDFDLKVKNNAHFGATVVKGGRLLERMLARNCACDAVVMDFGGNDCDYTWAEIAADPAGVHRPHVPLAEFTGRYRALIRNLKERGVVPILMTLPPLEPQRFFDWWCRDLDQGAVRRWLGDVSRIFTHQESYSQAAERLAREEQIPVVDVRGAFLRQGSVGNLICEDGTHPNSVGQAVITETFRNFAIQWEAALETA